MTFLAQAFGAVERLLIPMPGGSIGHAEVSVVRLHLSAEVSGLGLDSADVGLHFGAKVSDVGLGGEVVVDASSLVSFCSTVAMGLF